MSLPRVDRYGVVIAPLWGGFTTRRYGWWGMAWDEMGWDGILVLHCTGTVGLALYVCGWDEMRWVGMGIRGMRGRIPI